MPKKQHQFRINKNDREVFKAQARCGYITAEQANKYCKVSTARLGVMVKQGYMESKITTVRGKQTNVYKLTNRGKEYVRRNEPAIKDLYKPASPTHDLKLMEQYLKIPAHERDYVLTESDIQKEYDYDKNSQSPPDMIIREHYIEIDQQLVYVPIQVIEVITRNYGETEIQMKEAFVIEVLEVQNLKEVLTYVKA